MTHEFTAWIRGKLVTAEAEVQRMDGGRLFVTVEIPREMMFDPDRTMALRFGGWLFSSASLEDKKAKGEPLLPGGDLFGA